MGCTICCLLPWHLGILRGHVCDRINEGARMLPEGSLRQGTVSKPSLFRQSLTKLKIQADAHLEAGSRRLWPPRAGACAALHLKPPVSTELMGWDSETRQQRRTSKGPT